MRPEAKAQILEKLESSRGTVLESVAGMREDQWGYIPDSGGWSVAQIVEHIAYVESRVIGMVMNNIKTETPDPSLIESTDRKEVILLRGVPNRSRKAQMPSHLEAPKGTSTSAELIQTFHKTRDRTIDFVNECAVDLRHYGNEHFVFKMLNGEQWLLLIALHGERHAAQITETRQLADFPA